MNVVITGANRGIGYNLLIHFATHLKDSNIIAISRNIENIIELKDEFKNNASSNTIIPIKFDFENTQKIEKELIPRILNSIDCVDILINNAAVLEYRLFIEKDDLEIEHEMRINFTSPLLLIKNLIPSLEKGTPGHIVNIGSMAGYQGSVKYSGLSVYGASKAALGVFTETFAEECSSCNIFINCLALGSVETDMFKQAFNSVANNSPEEMAEYIYSFALNDWKNFQGKIIPVSTSTP